MSMNAKCLSFIPFLQIYRTYEKIIFLHLIFIVFAFNFSVVHAEPSGVWKGVIGKHEIAVCAEKGRSEYYYLTHPESSLQLSMNASQWTESYNSSVTGHWQVEVIDENTITGQWTNVRNSGALPIKLKRIETELYPSPCSSSTYLDPQLRALPVKRGPFRKFSNNTYRILLGEKGDLTGIEIEGDGAGMKRINRSILMDLKGEFDFYKGCVEQVKGKSSGHYRAEFKPVFWNRNWISINLNTDYDCGGAHPDGVNITKNYNTETGNEVDLRHWFITPNDSDKTLDDFVVQFAKGLSDKNCIDVLRESGSNEMRLNEKGIIFYTQLPHVAAACSEEVLVPFDILKAYLNAEGKKQIELLENEK